MKKQTFITSLVLVALLVTTLSGCSCAGPKEKAVSQITLPMKIGTDDAKVVELQQILATLFTDYRDAKIHTSALFLLDLKQTTQEQYLGFLGAVIKNWEKVNADVATLGAFKTAYYSDIKLSDWLVAPVSAQETMPALIPPVTDVPPAVFQPINPAEFDHKNYKLPGENNIANINTTSGGDNESVLYPTKWQQIEAGKSMLPSSNTISMVKNMFEVDGKMALNLLTNHYEDAKTVYNNEAEFYNKCSKIGKTIETSSKVGVFVAGAIITGGATGVVGMGEGTLLVISGTDVALSVGETTAELAFGSTEYANGFKDMQQVISPLTTLVNIVSLSNTKDPGNLVTIADYGKGIVESGANAVKSGVEFVIGGDGVKVNAINPNSATFIKPEDAPKKFFPQQYQYNRISPEMQGSNAEQKSENTTSPSAASLNFGFYKGTANVTLSFANKGYSFEIPTEATLMKDGNIKFEFNYTTDVPYSFGNYSFISHSTVNGELNGLVSYEGKIDAKGNYTVSSAVDSPDLSPQVKSDLQMQGSAIGTTIATGTVSSESMSGDIEFTPKVGQKAKGTYSLEKQ